MRGSTTKDIPSVLLAPVSVRVEDIKSTVVRDGIYTIDQICTSALQAACEEAGLTE
ncbi:hypothetical protein O3S80_00710 [Streptomyces sp. Lzd4kr]|nr:hypothetical protein [Streptomyces sp. Lzd4kr]